MNNLTIFVPYIFFILGCAYVAFGVYLWRDHRFKRSRWLDVKEVGGNGRRNKFSAGDIVVSLSKPREEWEKSASTTLLVVKVGKKHYLTKQWSDRLMYFHTFTDFFDTMNIEYVDENYTLETVDQRMLRMGRKDAEPTPERPAEAVVEPQLTHQVDQSGEVKSLWQLLGDVGLPHFKAIAVIEAKKKPEETHVIEKGAVIEVFGWQMGDSPYSAVAKYPNEQGEIGVTRVNVFAKRWVRVK